MLGSSEMSGVEGTMGAACGVTKDSSARFGSGGLDRRCIRRWMGWSLDLNDLCGGAVGVLAGFGVPDSLSPSPLISEIWDLEWLA